MGLVGCTSNEPSSPASSNKPASSSSTPTTSVAPSTSETPSTSEGPVDPQGKKVEFNVSTFVANEISSLVTAGKVTQDPTDQSKYTIEADESTGTKMGSNPFSFGDNEIKFFYDSSANDPKNWQIDGNKKSSVKNSGVSYTHRIKSGGANNKLHLDLTAEALVSIEAMSSSSSDLPRAIKMENQADNTIITELNPTGTTLENGATTMQGSSLQLFEYRLSAGTYRWGAYKDETTQSESGTGDTTKSGGYNIYYVCVHYMAEEAA